MEEAKVGFITLGCDKNRVDSEVLCGLLQQAGFTLAPVEEADILVINTCAFVEDALTESIETIVEAGKRKEDGTLKGLIVAGCLSQRYHDDLFAELPEVDAILGTTAFQELPEICRRVLAGEKNLEVFHSIDAQMPEDSELVCGRVLSTPSYTAYLKISEGCDNHCTYCVIPSLRGNHRSRTMESLVDEAKSLVAQGVKELVIVAQDTSIYGRDRYGKPCLAELLTRLCAIEDLVWIRVLYCYPETIPEDLLTVMAREPKICKYLDIPIQHASDSVLKRMGRRSSRNMLRERLAHLREAVPGICLRTTLIAGFPGETEEEFAELLDFVAEEKFDRLGAFAYSQEEGSVAARMPGQLPQEVKEARRDAILELQKQISAAHCEEQVGKRMLVLVEGRLPEEGVLCARSQYDAPEVDGLVFIETAREIPSGELVEVEITGALDYDLMGVLVDEYEPAE